MFVGEAYSFLGEAYLFWGAAHLFRARPIRFRGRSGPVPRIAPNAWHGIYGGARIGGAMRANAVFRRGSAAARNRREAPPRNRREPPPRNRREPPQRNRREPPPRNRRQPPPRNHREPSRRVSAPRNSPREPAPILASLRLFVGRTCNLGGSPGGAPCCLRYPSGRVRGAMSRGGRRGGSPRAAALRSSPRPGRSWLGTP